MSEKKFNPYTILEVTKDDDIETINKKYKDLARKYHPDKNKDEGASEMFKDIGKAKDILTTPEKREKYDRYGITDSSDEAKVSEKIERDMMIKQQLQNVVTLQIGITEMMNGFTKKIKLRQEIIDQKLNQQRFEHFEVTIEYDNSKPVNEPIIFPNKGKKVNEYVGDLIIVFKVNNDKNYKMGNNMNLVTKQKISLAQSLCGFEMTIPHLQGKPIIIQHDKPINPDHVYIIKNMGLTVSDNTNQIKKTDIEVHFKIQHNLDDQTILKLKSALDYDYTKTTDTTKVNQIRTLEEHVIETDQGEQHQMGGIFEQILGGDPRQGMPGFQFNMGGAPNVRVVHSEGRMPNGGCQTQ